MLAMYVNPEGVTSENLPLSYCGSTGKDREKSLQKIYLRVNLSSC